MRAETVVWSMNSPPRRKLLNTPLGPSTTSARSSSLPTQVMTTSAPSAAPAGLDATRGRRPGLAAFQASIRAGERLYTVRSWPALPRWRAMAVPITPRPRKETLRGWVMAACLTGQENFASPALRERTETVEAGAMPHTAPIARAARSAFWLAALFAVTMASLPKPPQLGL